MDWVADIAYYAFYAALIAVIWWIIAGRPGVVGGVRISDAIDKWLTDEDIGKPKE